MRCAPSRRVAPAFQAALRLHLIETSPRLRAVQAERLPGAVWHERLDTLPDLPLVLLANEFLDALPIRQFVRRGGRGWSGSSRMGVSWNVPRPLPPTPSRKGRGSSAE